MKAKEMIELLEEYPDAEVMIGSYGTGKSYLKHTDKHLCTHLRHPDGRGIFLIINKGAGYRALIGGNKSVAG